MDISKERVIDDLNWQISEMVIEYTERALYRFMGELEAMFRFNIISLAELTDMRDRAFAIRTAYLEKKIDDMVN